jgi:hypothetical protein
VDGKTRIVELATAAYLSEFGTLPIARKNPEKQFDLALNPLRDHRSLVVAKALPMILGQR